VTTESTLIDALLSGASLRLVLHPSNDVQTDFPDMYEAFDLRHVILKDDKFFAKTASAHAIPQNFSTYDIATALSYAYSNFYSYVVNSSHTAGSARIYHKKAYKSLDFTPVDNFELIWESGKDTESAAVEKAITEGRQLKIALLDSDGYWNVHPVHMPSFYIGKNYFELFTDQDAVPSFLHDEETLMILENQMKEALKQMTRENSPRNMREIFDKAGFQLEDAEFYSTFYTIRSNGKYLRGSTVLKQESIYHYAALKVFADKTIGQKK
jgi:hypothetical protein